MQKNLFNGSSNQKHSSTPPEERVNYSISAFRVLYLLLLLFKHRSLTLVQLNEYLLENPLIKRCYNGETITKYINTLRVFGCDIPRASSANGFRYELKHHPFSLEIPKELLETGYKVLAKLSEQPEEELYQKLSSLLKDLNWFLPSGYQMSEFVDEYGGTLVSAAILHQRQLLKTYKKLCQDKLLLELEYKDESHNLVRIILIPERVFQEGVKLYLIGEEKGASGKSRLDLQNIHSVRQLSTRVEGIPKMIPVVFQLSGRLAKTYRLYANEEIINQTQEDPPQLIIKTRTDDVQSLVFRLMSYGNQCVVSSPRFVREEMIQRVEKLLQTCSQQSVLE